MRKRVVLDPEKTMAVVKTLKFESPRGPIAIDPDTRDIVQNVYIRRTEMKGGQVGEHRDRQSIRCSKTRPNIA